MRCDMGQLAKLSETPPCEEVRARKRRKVVVAIPFKSAQSECKCREQLRCGTHYPD